MFGGVLALLAVLFGLPTLDLLFTTFFHFANLVGELSIVMSAAATYGCFDGARRNLRRARVISDV